MVISLVDISINKVIISNTVIIMGIERSYKMSIKITCHKVINIVKYGR